MNIQLFKIICILSFGVILGCTQKIYGYSREEWNDLTVEKKDEIRKEAENQLMEYREEEREKDFVNKPINELFGTRSNQY